MRQVRIDQQPPLPTPPAAPRGVVVTPRMLDNTPMTAQEVSALQARRKVLSDQLRSADGRRKELSRLARVATGADKTGLEQRIGVLDARLARLESDIDETGKLLASAPAALAASRQEPWVGWGPNTPNRLGENMAPIAALFTIFVLSPIAFSVARMFWKRGSRPLPAPADSESAYRLERMEQAMEAIAIEIERVSEGQRFVTRLLAEGRNGFPVGAGEAAAAPVRLPERNSART
jgi:hypothetical protein